ncbi:CLUMA_CG008206, isoform A [Clunio marinus]|uniref:CLUMA_CG008206, isoform A n=1 Tax=Clunio marinus TaxID=568069 RepID=A0A1J1I4L6_9DIPT|nr:CLUMA_CG008206, isoform A [Clunio marinus]
MIIYLRELKMKSNKEMKKELFLTTEQDWQYLEANWMDSCKCSEPYNSHTDFHFSALYLSLLARSGQKSKNKEGISGFETLECKLDANSLHISNICVQFYFQFEIRQTKEEKKAEMMFLRRWLGMAWH